MRCIISDYYVPLVEHLAKHPDSLTVMVVQILTCIDDLRHKAHLLHRDISAGNIMYTTRNNQDCFILNDFDLAAEVNESGQPMGGPTSRHRTGTLPFMAYELLEDMHNAALAKQRGKEHRAILHCVRFDFESLFWVALWCAIKVVGQGIPRRKDIEATRRMAYLVEWEAGSYHAIATKKSWLLTRAEVLRQANLSPTFAPLMDWFVGFQTCFADGVLKRQGWLNKQERRKTKDAPETFQQFETLHDEVTLENLLDAMDAA